MSLHPRFIRRIQRGKLVRRSVIDGPVRGQDGGYYPDFSRHGNAKNNTAFVRHVMDEFGTLVKSPMEDRYLESRFVNHSVPYLAKHAEPNAESQLTKWFFDGRQRLIRVNPVTRRWEYYWAIRSRTVSNRNDYAYYCH